MTHEEQEELEAKRLRILAESEGRQQAHARLLKQRDAAFEQWSRERAARFEESKHWHTANITTVFGWRDRLRILFGRVVHQTIKVRWVEPLWVDDHGFAVDKSEIHTWVETIFPRKPEVWEAPSPTNKREP